MEGAFGQLLSSGRKREEDRAALPWARSEADASNSRPASLSLLQLLPLGLLELAVGMVPGDGTLEGKPPCLRLGCIVGSMWRSGEVVATCVA